ncbi:muconate/chloromuconate family cycloisomerase [Sulfitobacter sp. F26204]|uniref:muconate/chloromuconate family cycloisomerase n=1 Tax=Sulfitobacter sp. F26204 TaxID=2996014 RepID=UPI00225E69BE|nr:muconate/chloromuconate family cycloisomerase [Sulfitobacter sp. F26204]MCX7561731.1 muconate/chloromuconate family cycloisomerase [Sulfitobacter sp. F26204]
MVGISTAEKAEALAQTLPSLARSTRIRDIQTWISDVPIKRPHILSNTNLAVQSYVHLRVQLENGTVGWGEASTLGGPRWAEESVEAIQANIIRYLAPVLIGQPACQFELIHMLLNRAAVRNNSAKAAISMAIHDAVGRTLDVPAAQFLGGVVETSFRTIWGLSIGDAEREIQEAKNHIAAGLFNRFKIKLGLQPRAQELERLKAIRTGVGDDIELIVDINQAWSEASCSRFLPILEELDIALIEQPLPADQIFAQGRAASRTRIPFMMDECSFGATDALNGLRVGAGSVLSLKLVKSGGLPELKRTAAVASAFGAELFGGCLLESSLGAAAHLQAFASLPELHWGTEHFGPQIIIDDLTKTPLRYENFRVHLPEGPGLGLEPDLDRLKEIRRK